MQERKKYIVDSIHKCKVKQIHLFPTFAELEHGLAPSTVEMAVYDECGVPICFAYPQYFDFDTTSEKIRVKTTDHWYQQKHKHRRDAQIYHFDISKIRAKPLNLAYFGALAEEIVTVVEDESLDNSFQMYSFEPTNQMTDNIESKNVDLITTQFQIMEFAEKLKKDCLLAQDIMSDLDKLCNTDTSETLKKDFEINTSEGFWSLNPDTNFNSDELLQNLEINTSCQKEYVSTDEFEETLSDDNASISEQIFCNDIDFLLDCEDDYLSFPARHSLSSYNEECVGKQEHIVQSKTETEVVERKKSITTAQSTNPFLENFHDSFIETEFPIKDLVLNPNNPFLSYRPNRSETESVDSNSTAYDSASEEVQVQSWSNKDKRANNTSNMDIETFNSDSTVSIQENVRACSVSRESLIATIENDKRLEVQQSFSNAALQVHSDSSTAAISSYYNNQNWIAQNDNYCGYTGFLPPQHAMYNQSNSYMHPMFAESMYRFRHQYPLQSSYPTRVPFNTRYQAQVPHPHFAPQSLPTTRLRPPPGFGPNSNIFQVSSIMQTTVSSNLFADGNGTKDFYDLYNARLKLELESAGNDASELN